MRSPTRPDRSWRPGGLDSPPAPADEAMLRAYTVERALDYGCSIDDALKLRRRVAQGAPWVGTAVALAEDDLERAGDANASAGLCEPVDEGSVGTAVTEHTAAASRFACMYRLHAAACLRLAQSALEDDPGMRADVYRRGREAFASGVVAAARLAASDVACFDVPHHGTPHRAWLFRPDGAGADPIPTVIVWGGADGWCEAFHGSVASYLGHGLAVCLLELPGQGWARLVHGSRLGPDYTDMVSRTLDALTARCSAPDRFGLVGHSMGGTLALAAAAADPRIVACCTNGGSVVLDEGLAKFPRVLARVARMVDGTDAAALEFVSGLEVAGRVARMQADVLCLQGGRDPLVADAEAQRLVDLCGADRATLEYWPDGVHCLYDHAVERNAVIAGWMSKQLADD